MEGQENRTYLVTNWRCKGNLWEKKKGSVPMCLQLTGTNEEIRLTKYSLICSVILFPAGDEII